MSTKRILASLGIALLLSTSALAAPSFKVSKNFTEFKEAVSSENIEAAKKEQAAKNATVADSRFTLRSINDADLVTFVKAFPEATNIEILSTKLTSYAPLAELKNLRRIRARTEKVSDMNPLATCTNLESVDIAYNAKGQDLKWMNKLTKLTYISLIAKELSSVEGLPTLPRLSSITLEHIAPANLDALLTSLPNLRVAILRYGTFTDLSALAKFSALLEVNFYGSRLKDFSQLAAAPKLRKFGYYATKGADYSTLGALKQVQTLDGGLTELDSIAWIQDMPKLQVIDFFSEKITDYTPLKNAPNLEDLKLWQMKAPVGDLSFLKPLKKLTGLNLSNNKGVKGFEVIGELTKLKALYLLKNNDKENTIINFSFLQKLPDLKRLDLSVLTAENFNVQGLIDLNTLRLENLNLGEDRKALDLSMVKDLPKLRSMELKNCKVANFEKMDALPELTTMNLMKSAGITDFSVLAKFPKLKNLTISKEGYTDAQLATIPKGIRVSKR